VSGKRNSRTRFPALAGTLTAFLALACPAAAAPALGGSPAQGGTGADLRPVITRLTCVARCTASSASRGVRPVSLRGDGELKILGRNLSGVRTVIFLGRPGTRDDLRVSPSAVGRLSVDVTVPARAPSGRVALFSPSSYSPPSPQSLVIVPDNRGNANDNNDDHGSNGGDDADKDKGDSGPPSSQGLVWPVPSHLILSPFGENRGSHMHSGLDISAPVGTPVHAAASGRVLFVGPQGAYGNFICIAHSTVSTCYAHLGEMLVTAGTSVNQGDTIGKAGMTGNSSGPHVHFEVRSGLAMWATPVNPLLYLPGGATQARASSLGPAPLDYDLPVYG
jgi:hypothetical protein